MPEMIMMPCTRQTERTGPWVLAFIALALCTVGCSSEEQPLGPESVFVCTESLEVFHIPAQPTPAVNPKTGRPTLVHGLYCAKCDKWYPAPPLDVVGGNAGAITCPVHRSSLSPAGPEVSTAPDEQPRRSDDG